MLRICVRHLLLTIKLKWKKKKDLKWTTLKCLWGNTQFWNQLNQSFWWTISTYQSKIKWQVIHSVWESFSTFFIRSCIYCYSILLNDDSKHLQVQKIQTKSYTICMNIAQHVENKSSIIDLNLWAQCSWT